MLNNYVYYINGHWVESSQAKISFHDFGFLYGYGLFETLRFDNKNIFSLDNHINRILSGLEIIKLSHKYDQQSLVLLLNTIIKKNCLENGLIKIIITIGDSLNKNTNPNVYISIKPLYDFLYKPVKVIFFNEEKFPIIRFSPAIKSLNYIGNMLAKKECERLGYYEPVFYNKNKVITECAVRNIFFIKGNSLLTPSLDLGVLPGVMRSTIISIAIKNKLNILESHIKKEDVKHMDEAFISSTGIGLLPCYWDNWNSKFEITNKLKKELFYRINND
ncbi:MAG: hypothetical protein CMG50_02770 [Candidatus Marinimicrobia bacterium]|nr:hypothetical protein [Candidatus Neomarinimicrobiota bacterium]|tara:strand:+ start:20952 stop:21776 length:825 start_codon:yes stop_codon:yes gene_type:complete